VKIITEIRNGYKVLSKYLLSFRKIYHCTKYSHATWSGSTSEFWTASKWCNWCWKSKSAKVNVECYVGYANIYQSPSPRSDGHTWTWHLNNTSHDTSRRNSFELAISVFRIPVFTDGDFKKCHVDLFWQEASAVNMYKGFRACKSVHHHTAFNWINQLDAATSQVYYLSFRYSSTCFGHPHAHHQELV
jgi:hypothetical protein